MYGHPNKEHVERLAAAAKARNLKPSNLQHGRTIVDYEVRAHAWRHVPGYGGTNDPTSWGIWPRWQYDDRPDLGAQFGGLFIPLKEVAS